MTTYYTRDTQVAGTYYRTDACSIYALRPQDYDLRLQCEPGNPYDKHAIAVRAMRNDGGAPSNLLLGYIPAHLAKRIHDDGQELNLQPILSFTAFKNHHDNIYIDLIIPEQTDGNIDNGADEPISASHANSTETESQMGQGSSSEHTQHPSNGPVRFGQDT